METPWQIIRMLLGWLVEYHIKTPRNVPILILLVPPKHQKNYITPYSSRIQRGRIGGRRQDCSSPAMFASPSSLTSAQHVSSRRIASAYLLSMRPHSIFVFDCCIGVHIPSCCTVSASPRAITSCLLNMPPPDLDPPPPGAAASCLLMPKSEDSHCATASHPPAHQPVIAPPFLVHLRLPPPICLLLSRAGRGARTFIFGIAKLATVAGRVFLTGYCVLNPTSRKEKHNLNRVNFR